LQLTTDAKTLLLYSSHMPQKHALPPLAKKIYWLSVFVIILLGISTIYTNYLKPSPIIQSYPLNDDSSQSYSFPLHSYTFLYPKEFKGPADANHQLTATSSKYTLTTRWDEDASGSSAKTIAKIQAKFDQKDPSVMIKTKILPDGKTTWKFYFESLMSGNSYFIRNVYVPWDTGFILLSVSADTNLPGNQEPEVYTTVENLTDQITDSFRVIIE